MCVGVFTWHLEVEFQSIPEECPCILSNSWQWHPFSETQQWRACAQTWMSKKWSKDLNWSFNYQSATKNISKKTRVKFYATIKWPKFWGGDTVVTRLHVIYNWYHEPFILFGRVIFLFVFFEISVRFHISLRGVPQFKLVVYFSQSIYPKPHVFVIFGISFELNEETNY